MRVMITLSLLFGIMFIAIVPVRMIQLNGPKTLTSLPTTANNHSKFHQILITPPSLHPQLSARGRNDNVTDYDDVVVVEGNDGGKGKRRKLLTEITINEPKMVDLGGRCNDCVNKFCKIGLICTPTTGLCVGPAKKGQNCSADASGYMCESGSWCSEDEICVGEVGKGKPCTENYECQGGMGCNLGKCAKWYSITKNNPAQSYDFCEVGLGFDTKNQKCVVLEELACTNVKNCTVEGFGVTDAIFYTCNPTTNLCQYKGPYCWYFLEAISMRSEYNNYYDNSQPRVSVDVWEDYAACMYQSKSAKGAGDVNDGERLAQVEWYFMESQTQWVDTGGSCSNSHVERCKIGSYCANYTCKLFPKENDPCGLQQGAHNDRWPYYVCDVEGYLWCSNYTFYDTEQYVGPIGTCMKGNAKNGSKCSWQQYLATAPEYGENYIGETVSCDETNGMYCNTIEGIGTNNQSGYCTRFGSVPAGKNASWGIFCENGLYYDFHEGYQKCLSFEQADRSCDVWEDCTGFQRGYCGLYGVDYHYEDDVFRFGWEYYDYFEAQVACVDSKCAYIGPDNCNKEYEKSVLFTLMNDDVPERCNYAKCQLRDSVTKDYTLCVQTSSASLLSFSSSGLFVFLIFGASILLL